MSLLPQPVVSDEAFVLRSWPSGETSLVVSVLTAKHGFQRLLAKSARRSRSALRPLVQPGSLATLEFTLVEDRELQYLRAGSLVPEAVAGGATLEAAAYLLAAVEILDRCRVSGGEDVLFAVARDFAGRLASARAGAEAPVFYIFEMALLELHGIAPQLEACVRCDAASEDDGAGWFDPASGGRICASCAAGAHDVALRPLPVGQLAFLRQLAAGRAGEDLSREQIRGAGILLHHFLAYHLPGYRLPAALDMLRPTAAPPD